jgi:hypothetical protein
MKQYLAAIMLLVLSASFAKAEIILMECNPEKNKSLTRIILIDTVKKQATHWAKFSPTQTNGPFGPYNADISDEKVVWINVSTSGKMMSTTR